MSHTIASAPPTAPGERPGFGDEMGALRQLVDARLDQLVPMAGRPSLAARHSLLAPGKRLRAILTLLAARQCGGSDEAALDTACAVEMVHTASLVFDDLPAMDDARLRRGVETAHVQFGEDVAILAGIGLLNGAFGAVAKDKSLSSAQIQMIVGILSDCIGWTGLVHGQALDLEACDGEAAVDDIHYGKTGTLFIAAALAGAATATLDDQTCTMFTSYGTALGHAYQAYDDVLDLIADDGVAGKTTGRDSDKLTALSTARGRDEQIEAGLTRAEHHLKLARAATMTGTDETPLSLLASHIGRYFRKTFATVS
ncbi:polyprenyl synthetase family protein [Parvularcula sp. LCG005]|uniref:polyprenyl synthetase family protein n=1 Tax=Parvularcula sp. LCG005 TaxID=3078805 RepID=UPI00294328BF|nr:polyprenyl synthetase family protein [Parvularcula sp. LCG005]WOI54766.1 polyprenyl synthetase family protein [Parvularcula sp. LCG005]